MVSIGLGDRWIVAGSSLFRPFFFFFFFSREGRVVFDWCGDSSELEFESIVGGGVLGSLYELMRILLSSLENGG